MAEAITGVPAANASVSTMPKLSPESDGAQRTSAACSSAHSSSSETRPRMSIEPSSSGSGSQRLTSSSPAPITVSRAGTCSTRALKAVSRIGSPLRSSGRPTKRTRSSSPGVFSPAGGPSMSTPLGTIVYSPPYQRIPVQAAASETAIRAESRLSMRRAPRELAM